MRWVAFVVMATGLSLAATAVAMGKKHIDRIQAENTVIETVPTEPVVAFRRSLEKGYRVTKDDLVTVDYVTTSVPPSAIDDALAVVGMQVVRDVSSGQPVLAALVTSEPVTLSPVMIKMRRGIDVTETCVANCVQK